MEEGGLRSFHPQTQALSPSAWLLIAQREPDGSTSRADMLEGGGCWQTSCLQETCKGVGALWAYPNPSNPEPKTFLLCSPSPLSKRALGRAPVASYVGTPQWG